MMPPQTEIYQHTVRIFWTDEAELDSGGIPLTGYGILLRTWNNEYVSVSDCVSTPAMLTNRECFVPIDTLRASPFFLSQGTVVQAKVSAINNIGASTYSNANMVGALIEIVPHKPAVAPMRDPTTLKNKLVINVTPITGHLTGGASIISYELEMNSGSGFVSIEGGIPATYKLTT